MKMTTQLAIFFVAFNAVAGLMMATGVSDDLGINTETGTPEQINEAAEETEVDLGNDVEGGTLFGMYNQLTQGVGSIFNAVLPGMRLLKNFVPDAWVNFVLTPLGSLLVTKDAIAFARGTDL